MNKNLVTYSLIFLLIVPIFGFNFLISFIGNILILILLIPLLIFIVLLISFNSLNSKAKTCNECGAVNLGLNDTCINCGANLGDTNTKNFEISEKASQTTIEVNAEEVN